MKKPTTRSKPAPRTLRTTELADITGGGGTKVQWDWTKPATTAQDDWESPQQS